MMRISWAVVWTSAAIAACTTPPPADPNDALIAKGRKLFSEETFDGNGRTCSTCHPAENNFTLDPAFIATLPEDDPLFVAELQPDLGENFENPRLMRERAMILENLDGFDDLANRFTMRGIPHTLGLRTSVDSPDGPRTGWSGDGAPGDGTLRSFATGAVIQHFTKTTDRVAGVDFRLPTEDELDALEAFQLSLGRQEELKLPLPLKGVVPARGQEIFMDPTLGKCNLCHENAGANANIPSVGIIGNANFNTGVEDLPDQPADLTGERVPPDDGFGVPGDGTFNTPSLVEAADTGPFFHNNAVETIEGAVGFYDGDAFNESPSGRRLAELDPEGAGIELDATQIVAVAAFLRVINALENVRQTRESLSRVADDRALGGRSRRDVFRVATADITDAIDDLRGGGLHPDAVAELRTALALAQEGLRRGSSRSQARKVIAKLDVVRGKLVGTP